MTLVREIVPPVEGPLIDELTALWEQTFNVASEALPPILQGDERDENRDYFYLVQADERVVGTSHLTVAPLDSALGGVGEVAVPFEYRRQGYATALCTAARDRFRGLGGDALFLGTVNPSAARVYHRLGWRRLAGSTVMACVTSERSPEEFVVDYFRAAGETSCVSISNGSARDRVPMIPLLLCPHDWQVLDFNVRLNSTRYEVQNSCMGLYPRYQELCKDDKGCWFSAHTQAGRLVGIASACVTQAGRAQVDGMAHQLYLSVWEELIDTAVCWARSRSDVVEALVSVEDEDKRARFEACGFRLARSREIETFQLAGREVGAGRLIL